MLNKRLGNLFLSLLFLLEMLFSDSMKLHIKLLNKILIFFIFELVVYLYYTTYSCRQDLLPILRGMVLNLWRMLYLDQEQD